MSRPSPQIDAPVNNIADMDKTHRRDVQFYSPGYDQSNSRGSQRRFSTRETIKPFMSLIAADVGNDQYFNNQLANNFLIKRSVFVGIIFVIIYLG